MSFSLAEKDVLFEQYFKKSLITKGFIQNGHRNGHWTFYFPSQQLNFHGHFASDAKMGTWAFFDEKGHMFTKTTFANNQIDSLVAYYQDGYKTAHEHFKDGMFTGQTTFFYPNGDVMATLDEKKDRVRLVHYHTNGELKLETVEWLGKKTDTTKVYYPNGQIKESFSFYKNVLLAVGPSYDPNGTELPGGSFLNGKGLVIRYHDNGNTKSTANYDGGLKHGIVQVYHENGQLMSAGMFSKGVRMGMWKHFDDKGNALSPTEHRGNEADDEFSLEFTSSGLKIYKVSLPPQFPGGDKAFGRYFKEKTAALDLPKLLGDNAAIVVELDEFGFVQHLDCHAPLLDDMKQKEVEAVLSDFPRCQPAFANGLPIRSSLTQAVY
jgi:antitoxin component YwqK of YwqJK toxin-antitoxin module